MTYHFTTLDDCGLDWLNEFHRSGMEASVLFQDDRDPYNERFSLEMRENVSLMSAPERGVPIGWAYSAL